MGLDLRIKVNKALPCPCCGQLRAKYEVDYEEYGGRKWWSVVNATGYCEADYGEDKEIDNAHFDKFVDEMKNMGEEGYAERLKGLHDSGYHVFINADW